MGTPTGVAAQYTSVTPPYQQITWAAGPGGSDLLGVAVRPDGYLITDYEGGSPGDDGYLHLLAPWDTTVGPANRFGPHIGDVGQPVILGDALYVAGGPVQPPSSPNASHVALHKIGLSDGADLGIVAWVAPQAVLSITADHANGELLAIDPQGGQCSVVDVDPQSGAETRLFSCGTSGDTLEGLATDSSGQHIFLGDSADVRVTDRAGNIQYVVAAHDSPDAVVMVEQGCFAGNLVFNDDEQDLFRLANPSSTNNSATPLAQAGAPPGGQPTIGYLTADPHGNVVAAYQNEVVILACPGYKKPNPPGNTNGPTTPGSNPGGQPRPTLPAGPQAPVSTTGGGHGAVLAGPGGPVAPAAQPAPATQAQTSTASQAAQQPMSVTQGSYQAAGQVATAPNVVGVVDVPDHQHVMGMTAVAIDNRDDPVQHLPLGVGVVALIGAGAVLVTRRRSSMPAPRLLSSGDDPAAR